MAAELAELFKLDREDELSSLQPLSVADIMGIAELYPNISRQYIEFIRLIGIGTTTRGFHIYEPENASLVKLHPSFQLCQSNSYREAYGARPPGHAIPADAVMIADIGASWRYCLCPSRGEGVFCLDMGGPLLEAESEDFFSFVANTVMLG